MGNSYREPATDTELIAHLKRERDMYKDDAERFKKTYEDRMVNEKKQRIRIITARSFLQLSVTAVFYAMILVSHILPASADPNPLTINPIWHFFTISCNLFAAAWQIHKAVK